MDLWITCRADFWVKILEAVPSDCYVKVAIIIFFFCCHNVSLIDITRFIMLFLDKPVKRPALSD